jgi:hypothetical protein
MYFQLNEKTVHLFDCVNYFETLVHDLYDLRGIAITSVPSQSVKIDISTI